MPSDYFGGIHIKVLDSNDTSYTLVAAQTLKDISDHRHTGAGDGHKLDGAASIVTESILGGVGGQIGANTITDYNIDTLSFPTLANNTYITARNFADNADIDMWKINVSDLLEHGASIEALRLANNKTLGGKNVGGTDQDWMKANTSDQWEWLNTARTQSLLAKTDATYSIGDATHRYVDEYLSGGLYIGGTAAANKLDFFETGTWTPTVSGSTSTGAGTYTNQSGDYVRIGKYVFITFYCEWTAHTGTGNIRLTNLPYTPINNPRLMTGTVGVGGYTYAIDQMTLWLQNGIINIVGSTTGAAATLLALDTAANIRGMLMYRMT